MFVSENVYPFLYFVIFPHPYLILVDPNRFLQSINPS